MKNAYILHGCPDRDEYMGNDHPSPSNAHWIPWMQKQLLMKGYNCQTPEMPVPYAPEYDDWLKIFEALPIDENTTLIAHSCGAGFLLKWLNKSGASIDKLILVAPYLDPGGYMGRFLQCRLKPGLMDQVHELHVFYSEDEPVGGVKETVDMIMESYTDATLHCFKDKRHFCYNDMEEGGSFPELLKVAIA